MAGDTSLMQGPRAAPRAFWIVLGLAGSLCVALAYAVAAREWFSRDDFAFLALVQSEAHWSWQAAFLPLQERFWPFYRPLSMETFFWLGHRLFGLDATGYFGMSLGLHFLTAGLVFRLARQLGFARWTAALTALMAVTRHGSLDEIYYGSVFMYVGQVFFTLLCLTSYLDGLRRDARLPQLLSCVGLLLALLCNEIAVTTVVLLPLLALAAEPRAPVRRVLARALPAALPQLLLVALYLPFRLLWIAPVSSPASYAPSLGPQLLPNLGRLLYHVFGDPLSLVVLLLLALANFARLAQDADAGQRAWRVRVPGCLALWLLVLLLPFATLAAPQGRWSMPAVVPAALLAGSLLDSLGRGAARDREAWLAAAALLWVVASFPYAALWSHATEPIGAQPRRIVEWVEAEGDALSPRAVLVLLHGAPALAGHAEAERFRYLAYGGGVLNAMDPGTRRVMRFHDVSRLPPRNVLRPDSVYLVLRPDLGLERADPELLDRVMRRRLAPPAP